MISEICKATYVRLKDVVVINMDGNYFMVDYHRSVFKKSTVLIDAMKDRWVDVEITFDGSFIVSVKFLDLNLEDYNTTESINRILPRQSYDFKKIEHVKELFDNEKISLRLCNIYHKYKSIAYYYELHAMNLLLSVIKYENTDDIIRYQKKCLLLKRIPEEFKSHKCSPYMFFKVCEMALKYHLLSIDEFVYSPPCIPYTDFDIMSLANRISLAKLRNAKESVIEETDYINRIGFV